MKEPAEKRDKTFPQIPDWLAVLYVAITMVIMAYSLLWKVFPILTFFAIWFGHIYYKKTFTLRPSADILFVLLVPLCCCSSSLWSDYPSVSLYSGAALTSMVICVIIISRTVSAKAFIN